MPSNLAFRQITQTTLIVLGLSIGPLVLLPSRASAQVSPLNSSVTPWDSYGQAYVRPGHCSRDELTITVRDDDNDPVMGAFVEINLSNCSGLCIDPLSDGLSGTTNESGIVVLNPAVGGCADCLITIRAKGIAIRTYTRITSFDHEPNGIEDIDDYIWYTNNPTDPCTDFNGSGGRDLQDDQLTPLGAECGNANGCRREPFCRDFDDSLVHGWAGCPGAANVTITLPANGQSGPTDIYLQTDDDGGASLLCAGPEFLGDLSVGCYRLTFDMRIVSNPNGTNPVPPIVILENGGINASFSFDPALWITDDLGINPDWHSFSVPIHAADPQGNLPGNSSGFWTVVPAGASNWATLLTNITAVKFRVDIGAAASELIGYDNICLSPESCNRLSGIKWNDLNANGIRDSGEPVIPGWPIGLDDPVAQVSFPGMTNSQGYYEFSGLKAHSYLLSEFEQPGWVQTFPSPSTYAVTLGPGQAIDGLDFGNHFENTNCLIALDWNGRRIYDVNMASGVLSDPRVLSPGFAPSGFSFSPTDGLLYIIDATLSSNSKLYTVDPITGVTNLVGPTGLTFLIEGDLDFDPNSPNALYGVQGGGGGLFILNTATGAANLLGTPSGSGDISSLAFDPAGDLYVIDAGTSPKQIHRLNKLNGQILSSAVLSPDPTTAASLVGMDFDPSSGKLFCMMSNTVNSQYFNLDPTTGATTLIASPVSAPLSGLRFAPSAACPGGTSGKKAGGKKNPSWPNIEQPPAEGGAGGLAAPGLAPWIHVSSITPATQSLDIEFGPGQDGGAMKLVLYDLAGRHVATIFDGEIAAGTRQHVTWEGRDVPSGIYWIRASQKGQSIVQRVVIIR